MNCSLKLQKKKKVILNEEILENSAIVKEETFSLPTTSRITPNYSQNGIYNLSRWNFQLLEQVETGFSGTGQ